MWTVAEVVYRNTGSEEKEIRIRVSTWDQEGSLLEDECWITRDMLKEVLGEKA